MKRSLLQSRRSVMIAGCLLASLTIASAVGGAVATSTRSGSGRSALDPKPAERIDTPSRSAATGGRSTSRADAPEPSPSSRLAWGEKVVVKDSGEIVLEVTVPRSGATDGWMRRYLVSPDRTKAIRKRYNGRLPTPSRPLRFTLTDLNDDYRRRIAGDLFPTDGPHRGDWVHRVAAGRLPASRESFDLLARLYTPERRNSAFIAKDNPTPHKSLRDGQQILISGKMLHRAFAPTVSTQSGSPPAIDVVPPLAPTLGPGQQVMTSGDHPVLQPLDSTVVAAAGAARPPDNGSDDDAAAHPPEDDFTEAPAGADTEEEGPTIGAPGPYLPPPVAEGANDLAYASDDAGRFAIYRLKKGEALYSAVVIRYTGRIDVQEVNDLAARVARRSGIDNVTHIPIGFKVRIPVDDLLPEYQPPDDPRRQAWERKQAEVARYTNVATSKGLAGVAVILDAGHGGRDRGASHNGVWEHDYVYDILCRIKVILEQHSGARVFPTIKDRKEGFAIHDSTRLPRSQAEVLLTDPLFSLTGRAPSVNLRWYLANSHFRRLVDQGVDPLKIVFTSLHADARHPSMGGAMVYVPGEEYRRGRYGGGGAVYARYKEARSTPIVTFTRNERERSEGLSRQFANALIDAFGGRGVAVHPYQPVRERIIRRGRAWVPAVLRCNIVPVEVLIEVANLSNRGDSQALAEPTYRQKVAEAYVDALRQYFTPPSQPKTTAVKHTSSR